MEARIFGLGDRGVAVGGTTVVAAATSRVVSKINEPDITLASLIGLLENSLLANLPAALSAVLESVKTVAALDHDVSHLMAALPTLTRTLRYGDVRGTDVSALVDVADSLLIRICTGLAVAVTGLDDPSAEEFREHLDKVHSAVMVRDDRDASARWLQAMAGVIDRDDVNGLLVGRLVRLLRDSGSITETAAAQRLSRALSVGSTPTGKAGWVDGFLGGGGLVLVHDRALLTLIDTWVRQLREQDFIDTLPLLRRTFGAFEAGGSVERSVRRSEAADASKRQWRPMLDAAERQWRSLRTSWGGWRMSDDDQRLRRWRLMLGGESAEESTGGLGQPGERRMDAALAALYDSSGPTKGRRRSAGLGGRRLRPSPDGSAISGRTFPARWCR